VAQIKQRLPGAQQAEWKQIDAATPRTWEKWVYRKKGRVGGIPQSMKRALWDWTPSVSPEKGLYLVGDTTYPGQGIPGVTLSGINVYYRVLKDFK
jgi:phytoene dehydrogenase-like protein